MDRTRQEWLERLTSACDRVLADLGENGRAHQDASLRLLADDVRALRGRLVAEAAGELPPAGGRAEAEG